MRVLIPVPGGVDVQHERSRFVREAGRWYYLDAIG
ncbi:MAG: YchJ family metal-binding protein [Propionicimonas sp.]|nr:YchJ family metal-binding protein [Propionicimonas sp.]